MHLCWLQGISQRKKKQSKESDEVVNEDGVVPKCPENFVDSLEKSSEKDLCEVSEEVLDFPLPNFIEGELDGVILR